MTKLAKQSEPLKVETWAVEKVVPYIRNPRKNEGIPVAKVKASLKEFGWRQPIVVDSEGVIIVGHTRYQAALELGMDSVPVHVAEGLTAAQVKAYRIKQTHHASVTYRQRCHEISKAAQPRHEVDYFFR